MLGAAKGARCGQMTHKFLSLRHLAGRTRLPPTGSPCLQLPALRPPLSMSIYPQILLRNRNLNNLLAVRDNALVVYTSTLVPQLLPVGFEVVEKGVLFARVSPRVWA